MATKKLKKGKKLTGSKTTRYLIGDRQ